MVMKDESRGALGSLASEVQVWGYATCYLEHSEQSEQSKQRDESRCEMWVKDVLWRRVYQYLSSICYMLLRKRTW
jgi:hypothetical protein